MSKLKSEDRKIKCVIWDLDNTIWNGTLLEDQTVILRPNITEIIRTLDERGILQSICNRNSYEQVFEKLREFKLAEYFIYSQVNWSPKSESIAAIAKAINIGTDTLAFIDDQQFE